MYLDLLVLEQVVKYHHLLFVQHFTYIPLVFFSFPRFCAHKIDLVIVL